MDDRKHSAGKGDCPRKVDRKQWEEGWELAFPQRRKLMETFAEFRKSIEDTWMGIPIIRNPNLLFLSNAINEEAGELAGQIKKIERDDGGTVTPERRLAIVKEMGDALFYYDRLAKELDTTLDRVAQTNANKLRGRRIRGTIHGDGNNR